MATATETRASAAASTGLTLETDKGVTIISDDVVAKLSGFACREIEGVAGMGAGFRRLIGKITPGEEPIAQGVNVEVGKKETAIDIVIQVRYGFSIPELAQAVRENVMARVEADTGLMVKEVNVEIDDIIFDEEDAPARVE